MKEEITARRLLYVIMKRSFADAQPCDVLTTGIVELADKAIASWYGLDGIGWLIGAFWDDGECKMPRKGSPLVDDEGRLWSREEFGDELTDEEYLVAEKIYETARFCNALYYHLPFDLCILGEFTQSHFEFSNEALREWIVTAKTRRVAALVCRILLEVEMKKAVEGNPPVQDYFAEHVYGTRSDNWQEVADCEAFIERALNGMGEIAHHYEEARRWGLEGEAVEVVDIVWGWAPHEFEEDSVATGCEILEAANRLLPDGLTLRSDAGARVYIKKVFEEAQQIAERHDLYLDINDGYNLTIGYMQMWLERKYWGDLLKEEQE